MGEEGKKISFGFSKLKKTTNLVKPIATEKKEIEYVDSFDGAKGKFSYKGSIREEPKKKDLVIPLVGTRTAYEVIQARLEEKNQDHESDSKGNQSNGQIQPNSVSNGEAQDAKSNLDEIAAREIINEAQGSQSNENAASNLVIAQDAPKDKPSFEGEKESTLEDYENIPILDFGLAMLRGMGWKPETGIGKDQRVVPTVTPKLRPKGLGLGADKLLAKPIQQDEDLVIAPKGYVKFISGHHKGSYGQVEAVDGDTNRVVVKLALGGTVSVSEVIVVPVTKMDYEKNSKVLNAAKYEQYVQMQTEIESEPKVSASSHKGGEESHRKEKYDRDGSPSESAKRKRKSKRSKRSESEDSSPRSEEDSHKKKKKSKKNRSRSHSKDRKYKTKRKKKKCSSDSDSEGSSHRKSKHHRDYNYYSKKSKHRH